MSQLSEVFLLEKQVATNNCSLWYWSAIAALISLSYCVLHTFSIWPNWPQLLHLTFGLHQYFCGWWFVFLQWGQVRRAPFWFFLLLLDLLFFLFFFLSFLESLFYDLAWNAPSTDPSCLIILVCSKACKAFTISAKDILDRSLEFSKEKIVASYFSGRVTKIFWTILSSKKFLSRQSYLVCYAKQLFSIIFDSLRLFHYAHFKFSD